MYFDNVVGLVLVKGVACDDACWNADCSELSHTLCAFQWVSSVLKPAQTRPAYSSVSEQAVQLIPILYSISPAFVDADNLHTIELGLLVISMLLANILHKSV